MTILSGLSGSPPRPSMVNARIVFYFAFAGSIFCLWTVFAWYQGLFEELIVVRRERDAAINLARAREHEQKSQVEEVRSLKAKYGEEMTEANARIAELNATGYKGGYANYPMGPLEGAEDIVVVFKTGATEIFKVLPIHFVTTFTHVPNYLIFSDHEQNIGQYHIQDSLNESSPDAISNYYDFQLYRDQQQYMAAGQNPEFLELKGGWELDKFKNVHIMAKTFSQRPNAKWYLFLDADSYVVMSNLVSFLRNLDHTKKLYFGSPTYINDLEFAHGGTGYVLSHAAISAVIQKHPNVGQAYESFAKDQCCGDYVIARALKDNDISLIWASPNFNGEPPYKIEMDRDKMCEPIVTLHHMLPADVGEFWAWEQQKARPGEYLLFADVFERFVLPHIQEERQEWDNMGGNGGEVVDTTVPDDSGEKDDNGSAWDRCKRACQEKFDCIQFRVRKDECKITHHLMLGWKVPISQEDHQDYKSGWMMNRVEELQDLEECPQPPKNWPRDKIK